MPSPTDTRTPRERMEAFCVAYVTPGTAAYHNATASWLAAVDPLATRATASRGGSRYMKAKYVQQRLAQAVLSQQQMTGLSAEEYAKQCLDNEARMIALAEAGVKGTAVAAARYRELAGKSLQLLVTRTRDDTPRAPLSLPRTPEELESLRNGLDLLLRLNQPNPIPAPVQLNAGAPEPSAPLEAVADYEVLGETEQEGQADVADRTPDGSPASRAGDVGGGPEAVGDHPDRPAEEADAL